MEYDNMMEILKRKRENEELRKVMSADLACRGYHYSAVTAHKYMNTEMKLSSLVCPKKPGRLQLVRVPDRGGAASDGGRIFLHYIYMHTHSCDRYYITYLIQTVL